MTSGRMGWAKQALTWSLAWKDGPGSADGPSMRLPALPAPTPQRRKLPLEPELESVSDGLGLGQLEDKKQAVHSGDRAGKVIAKQLKPTPRGSTNSVWEGGPVRTDSGCQAAQLQRASMLERLQWAATGCQGQGPR